MRGDKDKLSQTFAALASPTRRAILGLLAKGEATVKELAEPFDMSLPAISKHIKILAQYRPCTLKVEPLIEVSKWTEQYRPIWEERFDRMDEYLSQRNKKGNDND
jgi:DNA-binding transcriptional ArsR family regulator